MKRLQLNQETRKIPSIGVADAKGELIYSYSIPVGSHIVLEDKSPVKMGQVIIKIPRALSKVRDITGGLPRVTELFEARNPSNPAKVSEIDGVVSFGKVKEAIERFQLLQKMV